MQRGRELFPLLNMPTLAHPASTPSPATPNKEGIAIIGIGCRFPGGVNDAESFWKLLEEGREAVGDVPADRWNVERFYDAEPGIVGKTVAKRGGFIGHVDGRASVAGRVCVVGRGTVLVKQACTDEP